MQRQWSAEDYHRIDRRQGRGVLRSTERADSLLPLRIDRTTVRRRYDLLIDDFDFDAHGRSIPDPAQL